MGKEERLCKGPQIAAVFKDGKAWANGFMVLKARPNGSGSSRFCFIVSKKVEKRAVVRNRVRRLMREVARLNPIQAGWDIVIVARKDIVGARYGGVETAMVSLFSRADLLGKGK